MKIAWLTNNINQLGGIEQVICGLSSYFSTELENDVEIISIYSSTTNLFYKLDPSVLIRHCGVDWREHTYPKLWRLVRETMADLDADILITCHHTVSYAAILNKRVFKGKLVVTQHSACDFFTRKRLYANAAMFRFADELVVLTESDRQIFRKLGCQSSVIPNANFRPVLTRSSLEEKLLLAVGRLETVKGFDRLIEAFSIVAHKYPQWKLCICGGGTQEQILREQVKNAGIMDQVLLPGAVANIQDYYSKAALFALTSRSEGFSLVLLEAMSYGIPVVSFELPAAREILGDNGGIFVQQGDVALLAEKLDMFMSDIDLRRQYGEKAYAASKKYMISKIAERWMQLFYKLSTDKR